MLLLDFQLHTEEHNLFCAERKLDEAVAAGQGQLETILVIDADKTLAAEDTGAKLWKMIFQNRQSSDKAWTLDDLFGGSLGYSYTAFRQATLLYEEAAGDQEFETLCHDVAEFVSLLRLVAEQKHVGAVVVTCGLRLVWEKVLEMAGLSKEVKVIGGVELQMASLLQLK